MRILDKYVIRNFLYSALMWFIVFMVLRTVADLFINMDEFAKLDMRVGEILAGENVPKSNKLLRLEIDLGCEKRQILAGIAQFYTPDQLVGRKVIVLANLAPRKLMGMESQGMLLAASLDSDLAALTIDNDRWATLPNGSPVS